MNKIPQQMLRRIVVKYGKEVCADARRCENLLNDLCGAYRREINVLVNAVEERVPLDLLAGAGSTPLELLLTRLEKRLAEQTALTAEAARWAVESWAFALDIVTDAEIEQRQRTQTVPPSPNSGTIQHDESVNESSNRTDSSAIPINPPQPPVTQPKSAPTINKPPVKTQPNTLPMSVPRSNQPPINLPATQPTNQVTVSKSGFGIFRGCLLVVFLLAVASAVLIFGVPYAIETMRETQRERNNEPPRFPAR